MSAVLRQELTGEGIPCPSESQIVPLMVGDSHDAVALAEYFRSCGFYLLPIRPPTVPEDTSRLSISLTASVTKEDILQLLYALHYHTYPRQGTDDRPNGEIL